MRFVGAVISFVFITLVVGVLAVLLVIRHYSEDLPDYTYLKDYQPPVLTRIYADDGRMMAVIAAEQRIFVPITAMPKRVIGAFLSAEDQDFYNHSGVDVSGIARAALNNLQNIGRDKRPMGASTITQQVAKNMLLTNEVSFARKIREMILATRLENTLSKDRILEIYLNEISLGNRSYGVAAAALNYFNKSVDELTISEAAYLGALPKAPSNYDPARHYQAALDRRNWVIGRMQEDGRISAAEATAAKAEPLQTQKRDSTEIVSAEYFAEEARQKLVEKFGDKVVREGGLAVKTSLSPHLQEIATNALRHGLINYDQRQRGWRGPVAHFANLRNWQQQLKAVSLPAGGEDWNLGLVTALKESEAQIVFEDGKQGVIPWAEMKWARKELDEDHFGPPVRKPVDVLSVGDVVMVEALPQVNAPASSENKSGNDNLRNAQLAANENIKPKPEMMAKFALRQVPQVEGALVALDPNTGRVYALSGGFSSHISKFNRATQAMRQPGSSFKPFVYMAALDKGFTPASLILDAPFEYVQGPGMPVWRPENYSQQFYGPTPLRVGIEKSRNVMTVRLANAIGMPAVVDYAKKFGIVDTMPDLLSFSLGAKETTALRLTAAYGMIVNGGKKIEPSVIDRVEDKTGRTIWRADGRDCSGCLTDWVDGSLPPDIVDVREQIEDSRTAYQMVSILEGVVQRGTAAKLRSLGFPVAGKTGTTNDAKDAWFVGFTPDLVCGVYIGYDNPRPLGRKETGASVAVPVFQEFMAAAQKGKPATPFRIPPGLRMVRVNPETEDLALPSDPGAIWEAFVPGTEPQDGVQRQVLDGSVTGVAAEGAAAAYGAELAPDSQMPSEESEGDGAYDRPQSAAKLGYGAAPSDGGRTNNVYVPQDKNMPQSGVQGNQGASSPATVGTGGLY